MSFWSSPISGGIWLYPSSIPKLRDSSEVPPVRTPDGYELGLLRFEERQAYVELMQRAGFDDWTMDRFSWVDDAVLPDAHFVVRETRQDESWRLPSPRAVCAAVLRRFADAGYRT